MWIIKFDNEIVKSDDPEKISRFIIKKIKVINDLKNFFDFKDPRFLGSIEECLSGGETGESKFETLNHEIKMTRKKDGGIVFHIYIKMPSVNKKMLIQSYSLNMELIDLEKIREI